MLVLYMTNKVGAMFLEIDNIITSSNGNIFRVAGHLCGEFELVNGEFPAQMPVTRSFDVFFDLRLNLNGWVNNRETGDLRHYCAHCDVTVMNYKPMTTPCHQLDGLVQERRRWSVVPLTKGQ